MSDDRVVWLVRHGEAEGSGDVAVGWGNPPLSAIGKQQAARLSDLLASVRVGRIVSSDLNRAADTAIAVARPHGLSVERFASLREINFGIWEGRSLAGIWSQSPDEGARWERDLRATPAGFGESFTQMEERVLKFWATALQEWPDGELVVVSHRGPLVVLYAAIVGIALDVAWRDPFERGTAIRMDLDRAGVATPC